MPEDSYPWGIRKGPKHQENTVELCPGCGKDMRTGYMSVQYYKGKLCCIHCYNDLVFSK